MSDKSLRDKSLLMGNEALARGAWEAGVKVVSSYPGTPSTEITEYCAKYPELYCEWASNEKTALETAIGACVAGARSLCCMKHVGLNVAADPLFTASYTGVNGGLVVVVADDPGMHSSQDEQDSRHYARAAMVPMLEPSDSAECLAFTKRAFDMSESYDTPVIIRTTTRIAHARSLVEVGARQDIALKPYKKDIQKNVMMPAMARGRRLVVEQRMDKLREDTNTLPINVTELRDKSIGVICSGIAYQYVREALPHASTLKLGMVYPLPQRMIMDFASKVDVLYVIEELSPFIADQVSAWGVAVAELPKETYIGEASVNGIKKLFNLPLPESADPLPAPQRPPVLCPGCPHRATFTVLSKLKIRVCGDIGCYTLGALSPQSAMDTTLCMGASIPMAHGMAIAGDIAPTVAVIGDSTFAHTGVNGLISAVYNHGNEVTLILDNATTGMTGHQENPTTGRDIRKTPAPQLDLVKLCQAIGVKHVSTVDPYDMGALESRIKEGIAAHESTVIIVKRPCVLLSRVSETPKCAINAKCKRCKACMKVGCPAISLKDGALAIDRALCVGCGLCAKMCKFGAISEVTA